MAMECNMPKAKPYEYNGKFFGMAEICSMAVAPCTRAAMKKRIDKYGVKDSVEKPFCGNVKMIEYDGGFYTYKQLGEMAKTPCKAGAMRRRVEVFGVEEAVSRVFSKEILFSYENETMTARQLGMKALTQCSASRMLDRIKKHGIEEAMKGDFSRGLKKRKKYNYNGKAYLIDEVCDIAASPCCATSMRARIRKYGLVKAIEGDFPNFLRTQKEYDSYDKPDYARRIACLVASNSRRRLSVKDVYELGESQGWLCALSGVPMTADKLSPKTNFSIDRIIPGGEYTKENIQLVCNAVNVWRSNTDIEDFIYFCTCVANHNKKELKIAKKAS